MLVITLSACATTQNPAFTTVEEPVKEEIVETSKKNDFDVKQVSDRLEVKDDTLETATLFKVTEGETVRSFFVHPFTLDLNEAREVELTVCVWNNDSTIQTFEKKVKIGTDEQIAQVIKEKEEKIAKAEEEKKTKEEVDKKEEKKTETTATANNNTQAQNTPKPTTNTQPTQQQTTYTQPSNTPTPVVNTPNPSTPQPAQKKCWQEQRLVKAAWTENVLVKNAWTEQVLVSDEWYESVIVGSEYVCSECNYRCQEGISDHIWDVHNGGATYGVLPIYEDVHHPAEYKQVNHPAEYKQVNHPAEYTTVNVCEGD